MFRQCLVYVVFLLLCGSSAGVIARNTTSDLSYENFIESDQRIKCLYGYVAEKTGDHGAAIAIFEDCIERWNDVYSMIWLAAIYETGVGVPRNLVRSTELMRRGAMLNDEAGYSILARYHYGVALYEGKGVEQDIAEGIKWLTRAADEGLDEAADYLTGIEGAALPSR